MGGVLEEGILVTGYEGPMHVTDPEDFPVSQDVEVEIVILLILPYVGLSYMCLCLSF